MNKLLNKYPGHIGVLLLLLTLLYSSSCNAPKPEITGLTVPEGFTIEQATTPGLTAYPYFATFGPKGRLFVFESDGTTTSTEEMTKDPSFRIQVLEDEDGDGTYDKASTYADKITFPMGGTFYDGSLYVAVPPQLIKFTDTDNDGVADKREVLLEGWVFYHNAALLSGPFPGPDGWMYLADARRGFEINTKEGETLKGKGARIWRCRPDGTGLEAIAGGGFDNAVELAFMPSGETIGTMTYYMDPQAGQRDALMHWVEGGAYPKPHPVIQADSLILTGDLMPVMSKFARVSPSGLVRFRGQSFGDDYAGNLFSAEFNTGRVMRHMVFPDGATYRTEDSPFMESTGMMTHPTDVFQDADGSLLIVDTGGWFIAGCPLSRMAQPDDKGGIYRIRKSGAKIAKDPWGKELDIENMSAEELVKYLEDQRMAVSDRAIEQLVRLGSQAVRPLTEAYDNTQSGQLRTRLVFALGRINDQSAMETVRAALSDESAMVRTAASRMLGLAKDRSAVEGLIKIINNDHPQVKRQAATALGQISDPKAVGALIAASENADDRMVEHAIIYSLITLGHKAPLINALQHPSRQVRKSALIALDQMKENSLQQDHLAPFLVSTDTLLFSTGLWALKHHPEWASLAIAVVEDILQKSPLSEIQLTTVRDLMITFSERPEMQTFIEGLFESDAAPVAQWILALDVISKSTIKQLPASWVGHLGSMLLDHDFRVRSKALEVTMLRGITSLDQQLEQIVRDTALTDDFRLKALGTRINYRPSLTKGEFALLENYVGGDFPSPAKQAAIQLLDQAALTEIQLLGLVNNQMEKASAIMLPALIKVFRGDSSLAVGDALISALQNAPDLANLDLSDMQKLLSSYPESVRRQATPILSMLEERNNERLLVLQTLEPQLNGGDVAKGRQLFFGKAICSTCHAVGGEGSKFGPDLSNIGEIRSRHDILEAILYPNVSFAREYETSRVVTNRSNYTGIIVQQLPEAIIMMTSPTDQVRIARDEITQIEQTTTSMMPPRLDQLLSPEELADLMAFLETLPDGLGHLRVKNPGD